MNRIYKFILLILIIPASVFGQETGNSATSTTTKSFTLEQCISYALENSVNITNSIVDEKIANAKVKETRGIGLPQVNGAVTLQHNQTLQRFFGAYGVQQGFAGKDENDKPNLDLPGVAPTDVIASKSPFQLQSNGTAALNFSQILFSGSYLIGLKAANVYRELSVKNTMQKKEQLIQQVAKAYYSVLINKDRMKLFDNNISRVDSLLRSTKALNQNGFAESIDVSRIQVTLNNLQSERDKFYKLQDLAIELLKFQMNYSASEKIEVAGDIASIEVNEAEVDKYSSDFDYKQRPDYKVLETNRMLQQLDLKNKYASSLPSLSAFATLGYSTQSPNISGLFKTNTPLKDANGIGPDKWYSYSFYGVTLTVPLFSGLQRTYQQQQSKLALQKIDNSFVLLKSSIDLEISQARINYLNAMTSLRAQEQNRKLAEEVARITKIKYEQGVGSNIEVIDAENALKESQTNYYSALYDAVVAKVDVDKAFGQLLPQASFQNK